METKEFKFKGTVLNGFVMLFLVLALFFASVVGIVFGIIQLDDSDGANGVWLLVGSILLLVSDIICMCSFLQLEPNEARVITWFGKYSGTFGETGFYWINPFYGTKKVSLRARNLDAEPIKVNDKSGNPIMIGLVLVWKLKDTYKALFEVDTQTMASNPSTVGTDAKGLMNASMPMTTILTSLACVRMLTRLTSSWNRSLTSVWLWLVLRSLRLALTTWHTPQRLLPSCCVDSRLMPLSRLARR